MNAGIKGVHHLNQPLSTLAFKTKSLTEPRTQQLVIASEHQDRPFSEPPTLRIQTYIHNLAWPSLGARGPNLGPYAYTWKLLWLIESSPIPITFCYYSKLTNKYFVFLWTPDFICRKLLEVETHKTQTLAQIEFIKEQTKKTEELLDQPR